MDNKNTSSNSGEHNQAKGPAPSGDTQLGSGGELHQDRYIINSKCQS